MTKRPLFQLPVGGVVLLLGILGAAGCGTSRTTNTPRTALEQLLISNAVDQAIEKFDFTSLAGSAVYLDEKYLDATDQKYVVGAIRHRAFQSGARLVNKADEADVVMEIHSGGVGTDSMEGFLGTPGISLPGPAPLQLPDVKVVTRTTQTGTAKLGLIAYDAQTREAIGQGGVALARSDSSNWFVLGMGPYNTGSVRREIVSATGEPSAEAAGSLALRETRPIEPNSPQAALAAPSDSSPPDSWPPFGDQLPYPGERPAAIRMPNWLHELDPGVH